MLQMLHIWSQNGIKQQGQTTNKGKYEWSSVQFTSVSLSMFFTKVLQANFLAVTLIQLTVQMLCL